MTNNTYIPTDRDIKRLAELYVSYRKRYVVSVDGSFYIPSVAGVPLVLKDSLLHAHLSRKISINIYAGKTTSKFVCFDVDSDDENLIRRLIEIMKKYGIDDKHIYVSYSGSKGYHIEIFFDKLMRTDKLQEFYWWVIHRGKFNSRQIEFRPTANTAIKLPLSVHPRTGNMCWFVSKDDLEEIQRVDILHEISIMSSRDMNEIIDYHHSEYSKINTSYIVDTSRRSKYPVKNNNVRFSDVLKDSTADGFPVLNQAGMRHELTVHIAVKLRYAGKSKEYCVRKLEEWTDKQNMNYIFSTPREIREDIDNIVDWAFKSVPVGQSSQKKVQIRYSDIDYMTKLNTNGTRRVYFYLLVTQIAFSDNVKTTQEDIAEHVGLNRNTIKKSCIQLKNIDVLKAKKEGKYRWVYSVERSQQSGYVYEILYAEFEQDFLSVYLDVISQDERISKRLTKMERDLLAERRKKV